MSFTVSLDPHVSRAISSCTPAQQDFFNRQILSILREYPYRFLEIVHRNVGSDGRVFYQYYDGIVQLVLLYRVYPPEEDWQEGQAGYVYIFDAQPPWW